MPRRLLALTLLLAGCSGGADSSRSFWDPDTWAYETDAARTTALAVKGPIRVEVYSFGGNVTVLTDPQRDRATVRVTPEATHGFRRGGESEDSLPLVRQSVELVPGELGPTLRVRTWSDAEEPWFQRAHVEVTAPQVDGLVARTNDGRILAVNIEGEVDIETSGGDVRVMTELPMRQPVRIVNRGGDIDYRIRGESTGAFDCRASGNVNQRAKHGRLVIHAGTDNRTLLATLNGGTNPVNLRTELGGDIRVAVVEDPTDVGTLILTP